MNSLKHKIMSMTLLITLFTAIIIGGLSISTTTDITNTEARKSMQLTSQLKSTQLNSIISRIEQSVDTLALTTVNNISDTKAFQQNSTYVKEYTDSMERTILDFANNTQGALSVYLRYNPEFTEPTSGLFLVRSDVNSQFEKVTPTDFSTYEPTDTAHVGWYYTPVQNKAATWLDPYMNANINVYMVSYVVPIFEDGVSIGVVGMDIDFNTFQNIIDELQLYDTGYAFLTNAENTILSHKNLPMGTSLNDERFGNLNAILNDTSCQNTSIQYNYNNQTKDLCYSILGNGMKLALTAPVKEIYSTSLSLGLKIISAAAIALLLALLLSIIFSRRLIKPITMLTDIIEKTSQFNFRHTTNTKQLYALKDETGTMARAVHTMRQSLRTIVGNIDQVSETITHNVSSLCSVTENMNAMCMDNSATTQQLAAGMEETSATTDHISESIAYINTSTAQISTLSANGNVLATQVMERANILYDKTALARAQTQNVYMTVKDKTNLAVENAKAVEKINTLTNVINNIASQTSLLALNASIEAARAGDAGRGFAIVASEIATLATQSTQTVKDINAIIQEVHNAVSHMSACLVDTSHFLENVVLTDYDNFMDVGKQYADDASNFQNNMSHIYNAINALAQTTAQINDAIQGINATMAESSSGVMNIAEKTGDMVKATTQTQHLANTNKDCITELEKIVKSFTLK